MKWYFYLGLALVLFACINFALAIQPFASWYIVIIWPGYILVVDGIVYSIRKRSLISNHFKDFLLMVVLSAPFWCISEIYNIFAVNWFYTVWSPLLAFFSFTTILPAILETYTLTRAFGWLKNTRIVKLPRILMPISFMLGAALLLAPVFYPKTSFPLIWIGMFLFIDPINYWLNGSSLFQEASKGKFGKVAELFIAGLITGFFWEMWNYFAYAHWHYILPAAFLPSIKLFEMPLLGYLGYFPFALSAYAFFELFHTLVLKGENPLR